MKSPAKAQTWPVLRYIAIGSLALFVLSGGFGVWVANANISGAIVASGRVEIDEKRQVVQHTEKGQVREIFVREGDVVTVDAPLIQLETAQWASELKVAELDHYEVMARLARLEAERDGSGQISFGEDLANLAETKTEIAGMLRDQRQLFSAHVSLWEQMIAGLKKRAVQIQRRIDGVASQLTALQIQQEIVAGQLSDQQALFDRGLVSSAVLTVLRRDAANLSGNVGALNAEIAEHHERITEIEIEALKVRSTEREKAISRIRDLEYRKNELSEQRTALRRKIENQTIRAPVAGTVLDLKIVARKSVVMPGETLLHLVPESRNFVIGTRVAPKDIDQLHVGQSAHIRLASLSGVGRSELSGYIAHLSADALEDPQNRSRFFRAEIAIPEGELEKSERSVVLSPGMPVEVFFRTTDQPAWAYLSKPLLAYFSRAFREN